MLRIDSSLNCCSKHYSCGNNDINKHIIRESINISSVKCNLPKVSQKLKPFRTESSHNRFLQTWQLPAKNNLLNIFKMCSSGFKLPALEDLLNNDTIQFGSR